uniref:SPK domain-containing protein n=1 Tax=Caenorhabditis tropicalis TaxID=1561998 RepID=A0A1I7SZA7_9PELO
MSTTLERSEFENFVIRRCQEVDSPINYTQLSRDFKIETMSYEAVDALRKKVPKIGFRIHELTDLDTQSKVRILFALRTPVTRNFLEEIRKEATVQIDAKKRIIMYKANDGNLILKEGFDKEQPIVVDDESDDEFAEITRSGRKSKKRYLDEDFIYYPRTPNKRNCTPRKSSPSGLREVKMEPLDEDDFVDDHSVKSEDDSDFDVETNTNIPATPPRTQVKLGEERTPTPMKAKFQMNRGQKEENERDSSSDDTPPSVNQYTPKTLKNRSSVPPTPSKIIPVDDHIKLLETLQSVLTVLEFPMFDDLQTIIENKIEKFREFGNADEKVTFVQIQAVLSTGIIIVWKAALMNTSEESESTSLKEFFLVLRTALIGIKIPRLELCQEKIKEKIQILSGEDKKFPIEKIGSFFRPILDVIAP